MPPVPSTTDAVIPEQFEPLSYLASIFTRTGDLVPFRTLSKFYQKYAEDLDADPMILPLPPEAPPEIPRMIFSSLAGCWRLEIALNRVNYQWQRQSRDTTPITIADFFRKATTLFAEYRASAEPDIVRIAGVVSRAAPKENAGLYLATHFCQPRWIDAPLNRPESFELHAHKRFRIGEQFEVNSWARAKTGSLAEERTPVIIFEQDLNTVIEGSDAKTYDQQELEKFYAAASAEYDEILRLYFPPTGDV